MIILCEFAYDIAVISSKPHPYSKFQRIPITIHSNVRRRRKLGAIESCRIIKSYSTRGCRAEIIKSLQSK